MVCVPEKTVLRHWAMQAALCLTLAGALSLAALVRNHRLQLLRVDLSAPVQAGQLRLRYPTTWELQAGPSGAVILEPPAESDAQRRVEILHFASVSFISPLELLVRAGLLDARDAAILPTLQSAETGGLKPLRIAGWPGVSISLTRQYVTAPNTPPHHRKQTLACTVLPSGDAIILKLDGRGLADAGDEHVIRRLAESISIPSLPDLEQRPELVLDDEVKVVLPPPLATYAWGDAFRIGRIALARRGSGWLAVELVPCMVVAGSSDDATASAFLALLGVRDPYLRWNRPKKLDDRTWLAERGGEAAGAFPVRAYLRTHPGGHALVAEIRWLPLPRSDDPGLTPDALWSGLESSIEFPDTVNLTRLISAGAEALRLLPTDAVEILNTRPEEHWQWYNENSPKVSSALFRYDAAALYIGGDAELDRSPPLAASGWEQRNWRLWRDWNRYIYQAAGSTAGSAFSHETRIEGKEIAMKIRSGDAITAGKFERSPIFVPGAVLPLVLGRLTQEPMILQTDTLPSPLVGSMAGILTLRLEPASDVPKHLPDGNGPMLCWSVRVNGSGQSSRWYFDRDKRLHSISFAGKVHFHRLETETASPLSPRPATAPAAR